MSGKHQLAIRLMKDTARKVNPRIFRYLRKLEQSNAVLYQASAYFPRIRLGKNLEKPMLRPLLARLGYEVSEGDWTPIVPLCAAVELLNISTYVIDDILDNSDYRQDALSVHKKYGVPTAMIAGFLYRELAGRAVADVQQSVGPAKYAKISDLLGKTNRMVYVGQFLDLALCTKKEVSVNQYLVRTHKITAEFIKNCVLAGALAGKTGAEDLKWLSLGGEAYGMAVQIRNDLMDFVPPEAFFREYHVKSAGMKGVSHNDFREGKQTLPVIHALSFAPERDKRFLLSVLGRAKATKAQLSRVNGLLWDNGSFDFAASYAADYATRAINAFSQLPESRAKNALVELSVITRNLESWKFV